MSNSEYKNHPTHTTVKQLLDLQKDEEFLTVQTPLTADQQWQRDRVFEVTRVVESYLDQTPSSLVSIPHLSNLQNSLQAALSELTSFRTNKNPGHLTNASSQTDSVITQLISFAARPLSIPQESLEKLIDDLRGRSHGVINALTKEKEELSKNIGDLSAQLANHATRMEELSTAVEVQKKEAVAVTAEVRAAYAKTETEIRSGFDSTIATMKSNYEKLETDTRVAAKESLSELSRNEEEAKKIVQVVGNIGVTGNYQKTAKSESEAADKWRKATIAFFSVGVGVAVISFAVHLYQGSAPENFWTFAMRFVTAIAIASPAFYTARESARHRTNADRARQRELELASLGPFIELLEEDTKQKIRTQLVERYFGNEVEAHEAKPPIEAKDLLEAMKIGVNGITKVAK